MEYKRELQQLEDELNNNLRNYTLQIMGHPLLERGEEYNTEVPQGYLEKNSAWPQNQLEQDKQVMLQQGFLKETSEQKHYCLTEEGQRLIEWLEWDELAESAKALEFETKRTERGDRRKVFA